MFLCSKCHVQYPNCFHFMGSHGRCEECGESGDCVDCHGYIVQKPVPATDIPAIFLKVAPPATLVPRDKQGNPVRGRRPHPYFEFIRKCAELLEIQDTEGEAQMVIDPSWHSCFDDGMPPEAAVTLFKANSEQWSLVRKTTADLLGSVGLKPIKE